MVNNVVPFGKYKGQPVEAMQADRDYVDWLLGQAWFKDRHQNIYTLIVNNFAEASETPEHNVLQALFLDSAFAEKVISIHYSKKLNAALWRCLIDEGGLVAPTACSVFEKMGADVFVDFGGEWFRIEIKPALGDDYPAVLRQIRNIRCPGRPILFFERYTGVGASLDQIVDMFDRSGIKMVSRHLAERQPEPDHSFVVGVCDKVKVAREMFKSRWQSEWRSAMDNLKYVDRALKDAVDEQRWFLREAIESGDDEQIRIHGDAMVRGWQAANRRMEDEEIEKAKAVFPGAQVRIREK